MTFQTSVPNLMEFAICFCFQMAVELKQGVSQLELLYEQITKEELAKQQKKENKKQKRRKKKEKRAEQDEKENNFEVCFVHDEDCVLLAYGRACFFSCITTQQNWTVIYI